MEKYQLNQGWVLYYGGETYSAQIPFSLYHDLLRHGVIDDPYYRDNETGLTPLSEQDCQYENTFDFPAVPDRQKTYLLRAGRVDTVADFYLNDVFVGHTENMFCDYEFDLGQALQQGRNVLTVKFTSPIRFMDEQNEKQGRVPCNTDTLDGFPYLRKASYMSGWDWAPRLPDMGIYGEAAILLPELVRFSNVHLRQQHEPEVVRLNVTAEIETMQTSAAMAEISYTVELTDPQGKTMIYPGSPDHILILDPKLWWPRGYGAQPLYRVRLVLYANGRRQDTYETRIGLRTVTIAREPDQWGESFAHRVNGVDLFGMGADYIPEDCLIPRVTSEKTRHLLEQCVMANYNVLRVWGGGYYPDDPFFDACDELGLLVWQDAMFCCATYRLTPAFAGNITRELTQNIRRLRHHACLGVWSGNNEIEGMLFDGYGETPRLRGDYTRIFEYLIPAIMAKEDPDTFYWPSSPSSGGDFDDPHDANRGDAHYWQVWHGYKPFSDYRNHNFRYASEFGFESMPAYKTIEAFTETADRNVFSYVMERHQKSTMGYAKMMHYLAQTFLYPTDFQTLIYASQLMQAEAMKYGVEHWRRHRGQCMGAIVWQLNDCWPVTSWSSIDYFGRWKALHYYEKRFFAPLLISCHEEGQLTQDPNPNARPYPLEKSFRLNVANETMTGQKVTVRYSLRDERSQIIGSEQQTEVFVPALSAVWLDKVDCSDADTYRHHVCFACYAGQELVSEGTAIFTLHKFYRYEDPRLAWRLEGQEIVVSASAYAKSVEILNEQEDLVLSDNYFDLEAGEKRVKVIRGAVTGIRLRSVYDIR